MFQSLFFWITLFDHPPGLASLPRPEVSILVLLDCHPARLPHEYVRGGTAKMLTLFRPADGGVRIDGATTFPNTVLQPWLKRELATIVVEWPALPPAADTSPAAWEWWQAGLTLRITLPMQLPPLRVLSVLDHLAGHKTRRWSCGCSSTPLGGAWLNMTESIQQVLKPRALSGEHPTNPAEIIPRFESVARHWNLVPTPLIWGAKRVARRK